MRHARIVLALVVLAVVAETCGNGGGGGGGGGSGPHLVVVSVGNLHACALDASGAAFCWGANTNGQLGNGTSADSNRPIPVTGGIQFSQISAGYDHTCAVSKDGKIFCWGLEDYGQVGNVQIRGSQLTPTQLSPFFSSDPFVAVSAGGHDSCAVTTTGKTFCWGATWLGELGLNQPIGEFGGMPLDTNESVVAPLFVSSAPPLLATATALSAGRQHTCGVLNIQAGVDNEVDCWGDNLDSEVSTKASDTCPTTGTPATVPCSILPVAVATATGTYKADAVTAGGEFTCGLTMAHAVSCWGSDEVGQLGSTPSNQCNYLPHITIYCDPTPTPVDPGMQFSEVSAGFQFACGVTMPQGAALCWGADDHGQLGTGQSLVGPCYSNSAVVPPCTTQPVAVNLNSSVLHISAGVTSACLVTSANAVYCWGDDSRGQLGNGSTGGQSTNPVQIVS